MKKSLAFKTRFAKAAFFYCTWKQVLRYEFNFQYLLYLQDLPREGILLTPFHLQTEGSLELQGEIPEILKG